MTYRLGEPEGIPASPDDDGGEDDGDDDKHHDDVNGAGVYDDDDKENLFIVLRLCRKHDQILSASHTVAPIIQALMVMMMMMVYTFSLYSGFAESMIRY